MKKVLFTATVDSHILQFHLPFLKMFKENGYEVHVATNGDAAIPYCDVKHKISFEKSPFKINNIKAIRQLKKICNDEKFNIIHTHTPMGAFVTRVAAKTSRKKYDTRVIYTAHGFHFFKGAPWIYWILFYPIEKWLSKYTDTLILINEEDYIRAKNKFKKCKEIKYIQGIGIDENKFNRILSNAEKKELRKSIGLDEKDFVMIYSAEISNRKRQVWLIRTLAKFVKENKSVHILLAGKDSLNGKCNQIVKKLKLDKQIHFLGYRNDIPQLLQISNIALSAANQEGLPVNIMEAMYIGLPIVASNCRGNRDLVTNEINGYLVDCNNKKEYVKSVEKIYLSNMNAFYNKNKEYIKDYLLEKIMNKMKDIYNISGNVNKKIAIITSGFLPVPASKGGAVENLIDTIIFENENKNMIRPIIFSIYDKEAMKISKNYCNSDFNFIKLSYLSKAIDYIIYFIINTILRKKNSRKYRYIFQRFDFLYKCSKYLKNHSYDKVLLENHTIMYLCLKFKKNYLKYKDNYYYHCHNIVPSKYGMDRIINNSKKIISVSQFRNNYIKKFFNIGENKCSVVLNCCSNDIYKKPSKEELDELLDKYKLNKDENKIILYIGRVDQDKGTLELVKAFNKINNKNYKLLIVGAPIFDTGIKTEYENIVKNEIATNKNIIMTGYVKHDSLFKYYALADVVVIPSQIDDSAPLVLIEAITSSKPVIATNCGGIPEYVNEKCAILIDRGPEYINNLYLAIDKVLSNSDLLDSMSKESYKESQKYSEDKYYNSFINELLK